MAQSDGVMDDDGSREATARETKSTGRGQFFSVDRRMWGMVCDYGEMNPAVAYLVLAQGTGAGNAATSWSVTSLKTWAGIDWERGKLAVQKLLDWSLIDHAEKHTSQKPRYLLSPWHQVFPKSLERERASVSEYDRVLLEDIQKGQQPGKSSRSKCQRLDALVQNGVLFRRGDIYTLTPPPVTGDPADHLIWLPNSLVRGTAKGEASPVRRLRGSGDIWALRLLIDLYHAQNLRADGGISPQILWANWERKYVGQQGIFNVWAFKPAKRELRLNGPLESHRSRPQEKRKDHPAWDSVTLLHKEGLLSFVPHLWESKEPDAEPIHPYGLSGIGGEAIEIRIGDAAHAAGSFLDLEPRVEEAEKNDYWVLAPVKNTLPNVQMIGVARLRYRPHTKRTSDWWRELQSNARVWLAAYKELYDDGETEEAANVAIGA